MDIYKLKKDLPCANAGERVFVIKENNVYAIYEKLDNNMGEKLGIVEERNFFEWLEELKQKNIYNLYDYKFKDRRFYYLHANGYSIQCGNDEEKFHKTCLELGNAFLTEKEMIREKEKRKAKQRILKFCYENNIQFADPYFYKNFLNPKFFILFDVKLKELVIESSKNFLYNIDFIFQRKSDAEEVLEKCEKDLKIYFDLGEVKQTYVV